MSQPERREVISEPRIREAGPDDYPALARLIAEVTPQHAPTPKTLRHQREEAARHPLRPHFYEWLAELDGPEPGQTVVAGYTQVAQFVGMLHPGRYHVELMVQPEWRCRGIGRALERTVAAHLQGRGAKEVLAGGYEDQPYLAPLLERRGFSEVMRYFDNVLELEGFDFDRWADQAQVPGGVRLISLADLMAEVGEDAAYRAFYDAFAEIRRDVPRPGEATATSYEDVLIRLRDPHFFPQGIVLAQAAGGEVVALSELWRSDQGPERLNIGLTGTRRAWRRKGLALVLKLAAMRVAREAGARELWTGNASTNAPMLALNERLGFRPRPAYVEYRRGSVDD